jgi:hypothetical protein
MPLYCERTGGPSPNGSHCTCQVCWANNELERLRAILRETLPFLDGIQNTTDVEVFREAGALLDKIKAAVANQQQAKPD